MADAIRLNRDLFSKYFAEFSNTIKIDEANWNIDKWRQEYPVDYLKVIALISMHDDPDAKTEAFKLIIQIFKLYIPDQLVKYYSLTEDETLNNLKFETLQNQEVYLSSSKHFNDPFDNKAYFYRPEKLLRFEELQHCNGRLIDDFSSFLIGSSFSDIGVNSMTMWANYANNHKGYCATYNTRSDGNNSEIRTFALPMQYIDQRIDITDVMIDQIKIILQEQQRQGALGEKIIMISDLTLIYLPLLLCNIKFSEWKNEKEFRVSMSADIAKKHLKAIPSALYIGANCSLHNETTLITIAKAKNIPVYKLEFSDNSDEYRLAHKRLL